MTGLKWTRRTTSKIAWLLQQSGISVSANTVARLLHEMDFSLCSNRKQLATDSSPDRNEQFEYIASLRHRFERQRLPIISVDAKKRELVGNFKNPGAKWERFHTLVNDHDFRTDALGVAIPYGIYDVLANRGAIFVGTSHETPCFAARSIARWWSWEGHRRYPANKLLILADNGGSNSYRSLGWKTEIHRQLCNRFGLSVTVAHYPTGASKWNPIEHRLFSEVSKNWAAEPLTSYEKLLKFIRCTGTTTGLAVTAHLDHAYYPTGISPARHHLHRLERSIQLHDTLPKWNYTIVPGL